MTDIGVGSGSGDFHGAASAARLERAVDAAHLLCDVLWEELHDQPRYVPAREDGWSIDGAGSGRSAELAERIADLASTVALLARAGGETPRRSASAPSHETRATSAAAPATDTSPVAVLIDERDDHADPPRWERPAAAERQLEPEALPAWLGLIDSALAQFERDQIPFAVLLIELLDVDARAGGSHEIERAAARAVEAITPASLAHECSGRYWLLVPRADRRRAREVTDRLARSLGPVVDPPEETDAAESYFAALASRTSQRRRVDAAPLRLAVGAAVCPEDGGDLAALVAQAHIELAAALSASPPSRSATEPAWR